MNEMPFDELAGSTEARKSLHGVDALVDDFLDNIHDFLENTSGPAVLVDQPWNRLNRDAFTRYVTDQRLMVVTTLADVPPSLRELASRVSKSSAS